jgi:hypothetical protein
MERKKRKGREDKRGFVDARVPMSMLIVQYSTMPRLL